MQDEGVEGKLWSVGRKQRVAKSRSSRTEQAEDRTYKYYPQLCDEQ